MWQERHQAARKSVGLAVRWKRGLHLGELEAPLRADSGAKFVSGAVHLLICDISDQAASTAFQSSGIVIERRPSLPVLN